MRPAARLRLNHNPVEKCLLNCSSLQLRCLSGSVLVPASVGIIFLGSWALWVLVAVAFVLSVREWVRVARIGANKIFYIIFGLVYLAVCFSSFVYLRDLDNTGLYYAIALILAISASDTGAYFTGKTIGGPKLAPRISPNKTWAGFGGAMVFCGLALWGVLSLAEVFGASMPSFGPYGVVAFGMGLVLGVVGQGGDLFMSFHKRRAGIKDMGNLIPGHGGVLDRIDSLLLACPAFVAMLLIVPL